MIPLVAAIVLAGAAGAGPVLVSDVCGGDSTDDAQTKCAVAEVERVMRSKQRPRELKVVSDGRLYSVPEGVEMIAPPSLPFLQEWWKNFCLRWAALTGRDEKPKKMASSECSGTGANGRSSEKSEGEAPSVGEHSCQICFEHDHSTVMLPCGHGGVCWDCGIQMYALTEECPMCREKINLLVRLNSSKRRQEQDEEFISVVCE